MSPRALTWIGTLAIVGCGGGDSQGPDPEPDPLEVSAISPLDGTADVDAGAPVTATFNRAVDPATLTPETFTLAAGGTPLATAVRYDAASRTATLSGPILPGVLYQAGLTTAIADADAGPLAEAEEWSFTTRSWAPTPVDEAGNTGTGSSLALDAAGARHVTYYDVTNADLRYATCAGPCDAPGGWTSVSVDTVGTVGQYSSLAIQDGGRLHVLYFFDDTDDLRYATCGGDCTTAANWTVITVESDGTIGLLGISLLVEDNGRLHASYYDLTDAQVAYATCGAACTTPGNWTSTLIDDSGGSAYNSSLARDGAGRLHLVYYHVFDLDLRYATCAAQCATSANWTAITPLATDDFLGPYGSLAVDGAGRLHVSYSNGTGGSLGYATCTGSCTDVLNWEEVTVDATDLVGIYNSLEVGGDGRVHVAYYDSTNDDLKYATCAVDCAQSANWQSAAVDQGGDVGVASSLALDADGSVLATYYDATNDDLKYFE